MNMTAYWLGNFFIDYIKMTALMFYTIWLLHMNDLDLESSYVVMALFPMGALPFTYVMSFLF